MVEITTVDGKSILVSLAVWSCYFPADCRSISLSKLAANLLFKLLNCELSNLKITDWVKEQLRTMFNQQLVQFESVLSMINVWLEGASGEGLDPEAA